MFVLGVILIGENSYWSLLGVKGLNLKMYNDWIYDKLNYVPILIAKRN